MRRNDVVSKRKVENVKHVIGVKRFEILKLKSYSWKPSWIFFNFIDLQSRYRTSSISHPFNFEIPEITVFLRSIEGSWKQIFRVRAHVCVCVRVFLYVSRTLRYACQAWLACMTCMVYVHVWRACLACMLGLRARCEFNSCMACARARVLQTHTRQKYGSFIALVS